MCRHMVSVLVQLFSFIVRRLNKLGGNPSKDPSNSKFIWVLILFCAVKWKP